MKTLEDLKHGLEEAWGSVNEGWRRLRESASGALTRFRAGERSTVPPTSAIDDAFYLPSARWAMLAGDVFEDDRRLVVRLEVPGMAREDFDVEVRDQALVVRGEKRFEHEASEGRYRVMQCAYGAFHRTIPLPVPVHADCAEATYRNGVLKIELPKAQATQGRKIDVGVV